MDNFDNSELPLVKEPTSSQSESVRTIIGKYEDEEVYIPDYQRDCNQWDSTKKSLFIESILNNLTIPAFFFCRDEKFNDEVIDGQQRLTTILDFAKDKFRVSKDESINYLLPNAIEYRGKKFSELSPTLKKTFNNYPLTIINLPKSMPLSIKLEVFRRINEGGTPLTGQDIRLAYYSQSDSVFFIRLAGLHNDSESANRILKEADKKGLSNPWDSYPEAKEVWYDWWDKREQAKGQTPSLMFLWYLICLDRNQLNRILTTPGGTQHLNIRFRETTEEALDIYCAQLQYQDSTDNIKFLLSKLSDISDQYFVSFAKWMYQIISRGLSGISVNKYKQLAFFIAAVVELNIKPNDLSDKQWNTIGEFIKSTRNKGKEILGDNDTYPESKGRWIGRSGQQRQCDKFVEIVKKIIEDYA